MSLSLGLVKTRVEIGTSFEYIIWNDRMESKGNRESSYVTCGGSDAVCERLPPPSVVAKQPVCFRASTDTGRIEGVGSMIDQPISPTNAYSEAFS